MKSLHHAISGIYAGERYILTLLRMPNAEPVARFETVSPAVVAAAAYLLEMHADPEALVAEWAGGDTFVPISFDWLDPSGVTLGSHLVARVAALSPR